MAPVKPARALIRLILERMRGDAGKSPADQMPKGMASERVARQQHHVDREYEGAHPDPDLLGTRGGVRETERLPDVGREQEDEDEREVQGSPQNHGAEAKRRFRSSAFGERGDGPGNVARQLGSAAMIRRRRERNQRSLIRRVWSQTWPGSHADAGRHPSRTIGHSPGRCGGPTAASRALPSGPSGGW